MRSHFILGAAATLALAATLSLPPAQASSLRLTPLTTGEQPNGGIQPVGDRGWRDRPGYWYHGYRAPYFSYGAPYFYHPRPYAYRTYSCPYGYWYGGHYGCPVYQPRYVYPYNHYYSRPNFSFEFRF
jgi:hypothetical protein